MNTLQMATTDELIEELFRRSNAALVVAEKNLDGDDSKTTTPVAWKGSRSHALGLAATAEAVITSTMFSEEGDEGEEWK